MWRITWSLPVGSRPAARSIDAGAIDAEWRALYPFACADYYRFLAGWAPDHFARDRHAQRVLEEVARRL